MSVRFSYTSIRSAIRNCVALAFLGVAGLPAQADSLTDIGYYNLFAEHPELVGVLDGTGTMIGMVEPSLSQTQTIYMVNSANPADYVHFDSSAPYSTVIAGGGAGHTYDPTLASWHATDVANRIALVAPDPDKVKVFDASYFYNNIVAKTTGPTWTPVTVDTPIINQSYIFANADGSTYSAADRATIARVYDAYANLTGILFVNGTSNASSPDTYAPGNMYNGITVGVPNGANSAGAHLVGPEHGSSYSAGYVSGAAALLRQAAGSTSGKDARVLKAVLINGATKTNYPTWSQTATNPLDNAYGAGLLNVSNSYKIMVGGQKAAGSTMIGPTAGWDLASLSASANDSTTASYFLDLSTPADYSLTATLTWNSLANVAAGTNLLSNFDLLLYDSTGTTLFSQSISTTENVEHLYLPTLAAGSYRLDVKLTAGSTAVNDTYALALLVTPEPGRMLLLLIGITVLAGQRRRQRRPGHQ